VIKLVTGIGINDDVDGDFFWKYHITDHANDAKHLGEPIKYSISRVIEKIHGDPGFFDVVEFWWSSRESLRDRDAQSKNFNPEVFADFERKGGHQKFRAIVNEERIAVKDEPAPAALPDGHYKLLVGYFLDEPDKAENFAAANRATVAALINGAGATLIRASINPIIEKVAYEPTFEVMNEYWFRDRASAESLFQASLHMVPGGKLNFIAGLQEAEIHLDGRDWF
jgi:hypothetical protein